MSKSESHTETTTNIDQNEIYDSSINDVRSKESNTEEDRFFNKLFKYSLIKKECNIKKILIRKIPILKNLTTYSWEIAIADFLAGVTVGLTIIPQAIAYSNVADLPTQIGLYSSIVGPAIYAIFGSSKDSPIGPTAIEGLLVRNNKHQLGINGAILLCFLSGWVELFMGILHLGFLIDFISEPVIIAFTSAAAIVIATTQIKDLLGLNYPGDQFIVVWKQIFTNFSETNYGDCVMGFSCIVLLILLKKIENIRFNTVETKSMGILHKVFWFISISRNLLVVLITSFIAFMLENNGQHILRLTGFVKPGLPSLNLPPFNTIIDNQQYNFIDMVRILSTGIITVPLLSILQNYAIARVYSEGNPIDSTQEMLALGLCNILSSFFSSMPISGALSRGAINHSSGVKTTFGGIYTSIIVILSLKYLTPLFYYIPKATLAAAIIVAVTDMIEIHLIKNIWMTSRKDVIPAAVTFIVCIFTQLEIGIGLGIIIHLVILLYGIARPVIKIEESTTINGNLKYLLITLDQSLLFPSVEYIRSKIIKAGCKSNWNCIPIVIDAKNIQDIDYTIIQGIKSLIEDFNNKNRIIIFMHMKNSIVERFDAVNRLINFRHCQTMDELIAILQNQTFDLVE